MVITESRAGAQYIELTQPMPEHTMADDNKKPMIRNASTLARREWIDTALDSVRRNLDASTFLPSTLESLGHDLGQPLAVEPAKARPGHAESQCGKRPQLYLAWSEGQRRSGT